MRNVDKPILPPILTDVQHQVLIGSLLGDFHLELPGINPRIKIDRAAIDKPYLEWQFDIFKDFCLSPIKEFERYDKRYDKWRPYVSFRTRACPAFLDIYNKWYLDKVRHLPEDLELTPLILAVWFADDGCIINEKNDILILKISTENFGKNGAEILSSKLEDRFKEKFPIYQKKKDKDQFVIKTSTCAAQAFIKEIQSFIIDMGMTRKYEIWEGKDLNIKPLIGRPPLYNKILNDLILSLKDFSVKQIENLSLLPISVIKHTINSFFDQKYFSRYTSDDAYNVYHYVLNEQGRIFIENIKY